MSSNRNVFGGMNPFGVYVPMSETEQELLHRLVEANELVVILHGWGHFEAPKIAIGDAALHIPLTLQFDRPENPIPVYFFDLELQTRSGLTLYREKQPTVYGGQPIGVGAGTEIHMVWDIGIKCIDPQLVKRLMPGTSGLTSRLLDKDTGALTLTGNMKLDSAKAKLLKRVREGEARVRADKEAQLRKYGKR